MYDVEPRGLELTAADEGYKSDEVSNKNHQAYGKSWTSANNREGAFLGSCCAVRWAGAGLPTLKGEDVLGEGGSKLLLLAAIEERR